MLQVLCEGTGGNKEDQVRQGERNELKTAAGVMGQSHAQITAHQPDIRPVDYCGVPSQWSGDWFQGCGVFGLGEFGLVQSEQKVYGCVQVGH
jgi:hypothetical protein